MTKKRQELRPRSIKATNEDWERWQALAESQDTTLSQLIRKTLRQEERRIAQKDGKDGRR